MTQPVEQSRQYEVKIIENKGFYDPELLEFVKSFPHAADVMCAQSLLFKQGENYVFPTIQTSDDEKVRAEKADQGFRARVARHTVSVGLTMNLLLNLLKETGKPELQFDDFAIKNATEAMILHDLKKIQEIKWRKPLGSSDSAYDAAEAHLADLLNRACYKPDFIRLAGSIGHNGAKDFIVYPWDIVRQCAYLSDDLLQETIIQLDILGKVKRLQTDSRYQEANSAGFPDCKDFPKFINPDGSLRKKYDVQEEATTQMAKNVSALLGIDWQDLGKHLLAEATKRRTYSATFS